MKSFEISVQLINEKKDLTIIYENSKNSLHKIMTSKDDFLQKLRFYKNQINEINHTKLIYIQENIDFEIFEQFISSTITGKVTINDSNLDSFLYLSRKYQYDELLQEIEKFSENRPDISMLIDELSSLSSYDQIDIEKEELIAKNLEISIQNGILDKLPIQMLNRILNSPKRIINDHHLLFSFVIDFIQKKLNENSIDDDQERQNLLILPSSLDYCKLTNDEIQQLFDVEKSSDFFSPRNSDEKIKILINSENEMKAKIESVEKQMKLNDEKYSNQMKKFEEMLRSNNEILTKKVEKELQSSNDNFVKQTKTQKEQIRLNDEKYSSQMKKIEEALKSNENEFKNQMKKLDEKLKSNYDFLTKKVEKEMQSSNDNFIKQTKTQEEKIRLNDEKYSSQIKKIEETIKLNENQMKKFEEQNSNKIKDIDNSIATFHTKLDDLTKNQIKIEKKVQDLNLKKKKEKETSNNISEKKDNIMSFEYNNGNYFNGIMKYLTNKTGSNIHDNGTIEINSNSVFDDDSYPKNLVDYQNTNYYYSKDEENIKICFDFKDKLIQPTGYSIQSTNCGVGWGNLRNWVIEVSNDKKTWAVVDTHTDDPALNQSNKIANFKTKQLNSFYRFIQLRVTGRSWHNHDTYTVYFYFIEFFGKLKQL